MKEHCKTCIHYDKFIKNTWNDADGFCEWAGEEVEDEENETCFEWEPKAELSQD